jgi:hypothetical protein
MTRCASHGQIAQFPRQRIVNAMMTLDMIDVSVLAEVQRMMTVETVGAMTHDVFTDGF